MTWDLIGHSWAVELLRGHIQKDSLRHAYLITGPHGIGKKTLALRLVQAIACPQAGPTAEPCLKCPTCQRLERMEHPDLFPVLLEADSTQIKIDQIRELIHSLSLSPYEISHRFGLLFDFELANTSAQNALLKTLEEPPAPVTLILTAVSSHSLLETITSRCEEIKLNTVPLDQTSQGLQDHYHIPPEQAQLLAHISGGRPGQAVAYHRDPALLKHRSTLLDELIAILRGNAVDRFAYAEQISKDTRKAADLLDIGISFWHDVLLRSGNSSAPLSNIDRQEDIELVLKGVNLKTARATVRRFQRAHRLLNDNANTKLTIGDLLLQLPVLRS